MNQDDDTQVAILEVSKFRNIVGTGVTTALGVFVFWVALAQSSGELFLLAVLILIGTASIWAAYSMFSASTDALILTRSRIVTRSGAELCRLDEIKAVERGALAFKPSGGFLLRLKSPKPRVWVPGLYWRLGRSVGVGGMTPTGQGRAMADLIVLLQSEEFT